LRAGEKARESAAEQTCVARPYLSGWMPDSR
jgi:hypothetical protein